MTAEFPTATMTQIFSRLRMASSANLKMMSSCQVSSSPMLYEGKVPPLPEARKYLSQFGGGEVDLHLHELDGIATITLFHPEKRNAMSGKMMVDLETVVERLESWKEGKGVILLGEGGNFSSGGDLDMARGTGNADGGFSMATLMYSTLDRLQNLPLITVAHIEGCGALGGGSELSMACDYRLMSPTCRGIGFVHGRMGIVPAWGGAGRLVKLLGYRKALEVMCLAKVYRPIEAKSIGLIDEITTGENPLDFTRAWLRERTTLSSSVIHALKSTSLIVDANSQDAQDLEKRIFAPFWGCDENKAALSANIKHRPPSDADGRT